MPGAGSEASAKALGDRALGDRALVVALRCGAPAAVREFVERFRPMLVVAGRQLGGPGSGPEDLADEVLGDAVMHLVQPAAVAPLSVRGYLLRSLRNRGLNGGRASGRRARADAAAADVCAHDEPYLEGAIVACASEHSVRSSHGPAWEGPPPLAPALTRLACALSAELLPEEQLLVTWLSHFVPHREIAAWLGVSYETGSKRIRRLRARLQAAAVRYTEALNSEERAAVLAFLRRAGNDSAAARTSR